MKEALCVEQCVFSSACPLSFAGLHNISLFLCVCACFQCVSLRAPESLCSTVCARRRSARVTCQWTEEPSSSAPGSGPPSPSPWVNVRVSAVCSRVWLRPRCKAQPVNLWKGFISNHRVKSVSTFLWRNTSSHWRQNICCLSRDQLCVFVSFFLLEEFIKLQYYLLWKVTP